MKWIDKANEDQSNPEEILSFSEYMNYLEENPKKELRTTALYLRDVFDYYGKSKRGRFNLFTQDFPDSTPVFGQYHTQNEIYHKLNNFVEEGFNNKFILLVGPNGSAKSSLIKKIMSAAEDYSKKDEGKLFTFSWIFPIDSHVKGTLGLTQAHTPSDLESFAHLEDKDISAILASELRDHPLLLLPKDTRQELIEEKFKDNQALLETIRKSYLYMGDISKKNRLIYDALLKNYKGDFYELLKHIRIERFSISKRSSTSATTIEPQLHVDAKIQQITMDKRLASLPPSLQSLNLFQLSGEVVMANRGVLEFSDLLKRPLDTYKYLLMTMETKNINLQGILTELDIFFIGSSNEIHLTAFKQHPDFNSFKGRMSFVRVPYLLNAVDEEGIYGEQIENIKDKCHFEPWALHTISLFSVMTRIRPGIPKNYQDANLGKLVASLSPIEKTLYLSSRVIPDRFNSEEKQVLGINQRQVEREFIHDALYEGKFGISPREVKQLIYELSENYNAISFVEVLEYLAKFIERKNEHDFLNLSPQGDYNNPARYLQMLKEYNLNIFDHELRTSLGLIDDRSYEDYLARYIMNITAIIKNEKIKNPVTGVFEVADQFFINEFESNVSLKEKPEIFRSHILSSLGAYSLDNPGAAIKYTEVFPGLVKSLKEGFREEQKKVIQSISKHLVFYIRDFEQNKEGKKVKKSELNQEMKQKLDAITDSLVKEKNYTKEGALTLMRLLLKEKY